MKILITGHLGLTGRACADLFAEKGWEVVGIDNNSRTSYFGTPEQKAPKGVKSYNVDIRNNYDVWDVFKEHKFDAIIHAAAQPSHDWATDHPIQDFEVNAYGTLIMLEGARKYCPEAPFVFVSTDKVYGERMETSLIELETRYEAGSKVFTGFEETLGLDFAGDRSLFGCSKAAADMYAQQYAARFGMKVGVFRPGCITGKNHQGAEAHGFLAYLSKCIKEGKTYTIYGNGKQVRDQIHASDLARAFAAFIDRPVVGGVFNLGGGPERAVSVLEAGKLLSEAIGKPFLHEFAELRKGDRLFDIHDVSKFRTAYPEWSYEYDLSAIIKDLV